MHYRNSRRWQKALQFFSEQNLEAAKANCESILANQPNHAQAHWMLSSLLQHSGKSRGATEHAILAARNWHNEPINVRLNISWALISVGENKLAVDLLHSLHQSTPDLVQPLSHAARQLSLLDRHEDALHLISRALLAGADDSATHQLHGRILQYLGYLKEAAIAYERALQKKFNYAQAHYSISQLAIAEGVSLRIDRLRHLNAQTKTRSEDQAYLGYALFNEFNSIGDTKNAWQALMQASACRRNQVTYDAVEESTIVDAIIANTSADFLSARSEIESEIVPVFIVGMPRTGTTLLERILSNHPDITCCGELNDFRIQYKWISDYHCAGYIDHHLAKKIPTLDYALLGKRYLEKTAWLRSNTRFQCDKNQTNFFYCGLIRKAIPQAKIIHLRRNAMDSCFSNFKALFAPQVYTYSYNFKDLANHYHNYSRLMAHWHEVMPGEMLEVNYEELAADPETQTQRVLDFCGMDSVTSITDIAANLRPVSTASNVQVREPIHQRNINGWKHYAHHLTPLERLL